VHRACKDLKVILVFKETQGHRVFPARKVWSGQEVLPEILVFKETQGHRVL
jgi:hypothetical protein